ncbi:MAG: EAL domain-containing protein [Clostridiales bacterium]|nr:EAL domain-containing protein [Clostridiales bacterium]
MKEKNSWLIRQAELNRFSALIRQENRSVFRLMASTGCALSAVNLVAQMVVTGFDMPVFKSCLLLAYFCVLVFIDRVMLPENQPVSTGLIYLAQAPVFVISILLGTVWDPGNPATTILMFLVATPVFILDHPSRSLGILAVWSAVFIGVDWLVKTPALRVYDLMHVLKFYVAAAAVTYAVLRIRLESMRRLEMTQHHLNHDLDTGCLSRYALEERKSTCVGRSMVVLLACVDQLTMYSDYYGKTMGDAILIHFARTLADRFGPDCTYRYSGGEILCLLPEAAPEECLEKAAACRKETHAFENEGIRLAVTFSLGMVTGLPETAEELDQMIQMAVILSHKAKNSGRDQTNSGIYSQKAFWETVSESNLSAHHANPHEINPLTRLPGMSYFTARSDELLLNVVPMERHPMIGYFKIPRLREFNDRYGYAQGDLLIADTAEALRDSFGNRHLCHITAGQFCILCYRDEAEPGMRRLSSWLQNCRPHFPMTAKAGFAEYTGNESTSELIDRARIAWKSILADPERSLCFYDADLDEEQRFRQYVTAHLDEAIEKDWLTVFYQPIVRTSTGEVCHEEALSRWKDPEHGFLMPFRFIPALEEQGLMYKVNLHVVDVVLRDFRLREEAGVPVVPVSVNLSRRDFFQCDMVREITDRVDKSGYSHGMIRIEITESAFVQDLDMLAREVRRFRSAGFQVWMDDFGSEYSTLNLLQDIDFDLIKIDMKFMKNLAVGRKNHTIVSSIIRMAKSLGAVTLMEGVETEEQYGLLRDLGCDLLQGYLFDKPDSLDHISERALNGTGLKYEAPAGPEDR